jgi:hydrogenase maturation factor
MSLTASTETQPCSSEHCITCGDDGVAMTILKLDSARGLALCSDQSGAHMTVETLLVQPVEIGDVLLVHAGTAIGRAERL